MFDVSSNDILDISIEMRIDFDGDVVVVLVNSKPIHEVMFQMTVNSLHELRVIETFTPIVYLLPHNEITILE